MLHKLNQRVMRYHSLFFIGGLLSFSLTNNEFDKNANSALVGVGVYPRSLRFV